MKKLTILSYTILSTFFFESIAAIKPDKIFTDLVTLATNLTDNQNGLIKNIEDLKESSNMLKAFKACANLNIKDRRLKTAKITYKGKTTIFSCNDMEILLKSLIPVFQLLQNNILGDKNNPGIILTILNILENAGIPDLENAKEIINNLSKIAGIIIKLLNASENKLIVKIMPEDVENRLLIEKGPSKYQILK